MGVLRFFLALSVVLAHTGGSFMGFSLGDGRLAVQSFYMISGFYMSMVWVTKYSKHSSPIKTFYISRALRIYPLYFLTITLTLFLAFFIKLPPFEYALGHLKNWIPILWVYITQVTLIGMETSIFYGLHGYWISPVAWSLGLELTFYFLVPFLIPRPRLSITILVVSLTARYLTYAIMGWQANSPTYSLIWSYRFFPFEVALFILGTLSHRLFLRFPSKLTPFLINWKIHLSLLILLISYLGHFQLFSTLLGETIYWYYYAIVFLSIWVLFLNSKNSKFDSYIGELSYPIYISHIPILWMVSLYGNSENIINFVIPITLLTSMILVRIQGLVDSYRHALAPPKLD